MRTTRILALTGLLMLVLAACGEEPAGGGQGQADGGQTQADGGQPQTGDGYVRPGYGDPLEGGGAATGAVVSTGETDLGTILTDKEGLTLYVFGADQNGESTCYDDCAAAWPALTVEGEPEAAQGVDAAQLGTTERTDGTVQVTYAGQPLYYFANDSAPGDTNGQGFGDVWFVVAPDGQPID